MGFGTSGNNDMFDCSLSFWITKIENIEFKVYINNG